MGFPGFRGFDLVGHAREHELAGLVDVLLDARLRRLSRRRDTGLPAPLSGVEVPARATAYTSAFPDQLEFLPGI